MYQYIWIFLIYSFLGWCLEVAYHALSVGKFINRGFLNGPVCPIYGFGMMLVVVCITPVVDNFLLLFLGSFSLTTILEFLTGFALEKVFHDKWWDYSKEPFNIKGYICLKFSLAWGLAGMVVMNMLHPFFIKLVHLIPFKLGVVMVALGSLTMVVDGVITCLAVMHLQQNLRHLEDTQRRIRRISDDIGERVTMRTLQMADVAQDSKEWLQDNKEWIQDSKEWIKDEQDRLEEKLEERLDKRYAELHSRMEADYSNLTAVQNRLLRAYPSLIHGYRGQHMKKLRQNFEEKKHELKERHRK